MDGINPRQINLARNATHIGATQSHGKDKKAEKKEEGPKDEVTLQNILKYTKDDLTSGGKLGVIIKAKSPEKLAELKEKIMENPKNKIKVDLPIINGFAAELDPSSKGILPDLGKSTGDIKLYLDAKIGIIEPVEKFDNDAHIMMDVAGKTMNIDKVWDKGYKGKGVTIAVIDTGIAQHPDIKDRIVGFKDFVNDKTEAYDDNGHGTHCSGIAAGDGTASEGKYKGAAPEASLVGVKVLSGSGSGSFSDVISGIQWVVEQKDELNIDVISMSLGGYASGSYKDDPVAQAVEAAVSKGIITCIAAGNSGPSGETIGTPATAPHVITVGALDDKGTVEREDDTIAYFSSRGPTTVDGLPKPDILTPGVRITAPKNTGGYTTMSGTSMACPLAAGMAALIKNASPTVTPGELKGVVMGTADSIANIEGLDHNNQGAGAFDIAGAIEQLTGEEIIPPPPPPPQQPQPQPQA
ncbi:MAG: S8 family peptidase [Candidatus Eremiobacteraeota bacterium]|nr:S8 family peptidase [Candidatus Eremiobacteraeota bacterium]